MGLASRLFDSIEGIYWFPIIALALFVVFFLAVSMHTFSMKKSKEQECGKLPFESDDNFESREV